VQKERNNRNTFSEIIMDMGKYFLGEMGKKSTFSRELSEKPTRGHTDFIYGIGASLCGESLCERKEIIEIRFPR
jgi:hypothetical protein